MAKREKPLALTPKKNLIFIKSKSAFVGRMSNDMSSNLQINV